MLREIERHNRLYVRPLYWEKTRNGIYIASVEPTFGRGFFYVEILLTDQWIWDKRR